MISRNASCVDCGSQVVLTSAKPVVRAGVVKLQCAACSGSSLDDSDDYDAIFVSEGDGAAAEDPPTEVAPGGAYGARDGSASGAIDAKPAGRARDTRPPAVIVRPDHK